MLQGGKMTTEKQAKRPNESPKDRFKRLASKRTNEVLRKLKVLGNCANTQAYEYTSEDVNKIFSTIHQKVKEIEAKFRTSREENFRL
jgi:uncharacterized protein YehS (DUF1456 family)